MRLLMLHVKIIAQISAQRNEKDDDGFVDP